MWPRSARELVDALVDATGCDHPRRAGLALHLGAVLDLPTVGVTHRPLLARGELPDDVRGATTPIVLDGEPVGAWLRPRPGARPLAVHAAWRTDTAAAAVVVLAATGGHRTPEPMRARAGSRAPHGRTDDATSEDECPHSTSPTTPPRGLSH